jgi:hypothetical protein
LVVFGVNEQDKEGSFVRSSIYVLSGIRYSRKSGESFEEFFLDSGGSSSTNRKAISEIRSTRSTMSFRVIAVKKNGGVDS